MWRSLKMPREYVQSALFFDPDTPPHRVSLDNIAQTNGVTLADLQDRIDEASTQHQAARAND